MNVNDGPRFAKSSMSFMSIKPTISPEQAADVVINLARAVLQGLLLAPTYDQPLDGFDRTVGPIAYWRARLS
jgi:hypothetical protein